MPISVGERNDGIFIIQLSDGQNRMNPEFFQQFNQALDEVVDKHPKGLITIGSNR